MSPKQFEQFTNKLQEKGLSFTNEAGQNALPTNARPAAGEPVTKQINETLSPEEMRKLSNKLESLDADI
jgi:hypothetical protein